MDYLDTICNRVGCDQAARLHAWREAQTVYANYEGGYCLDHAHMVDGCWLPCSEEGYPSLHAVAIILGRINYLPPIDFDETSP